MIRLGAAFAALVFVVGAVEAAAGETPILESTRFQVGQAPAAVAPDRERPQAENGALYGVVAPL